MEDPSLELGSMWNKFTLTQKFITIGYMAITIAHIFLLTQSALEFECTEMQKLI